MKRKRRKKATKRKQKSHLEGGQTTPNTWGWWLDTPSGSRWLSHPAWFKSGIMGYSYIIRFEARWGRIASKQEGRMRNHYIQYTINHCKPIFKKYIDLRERKLNLMKNVKSYFCSSLFVSFGTNQGIFRINFCLC